MMAPERIQRFAEPDEVARYQASALMDKLIKRMLAVGARFAPVDWARIMLHRLTIKRNGFSIALHRKLLQVCGKTLQILFVGKHCNRLRSEKIVVPDGQHRHQDRQVLFERGSPEMHVHLVKTIQHFAKIIWTNR